MENLANLVSNALPTKGELVLMASSGAVAGVLSLIFGELNASLGWLFAFVVLDYVTGIAAAWKTKEWNSSAGFTGIFKKAFIFCVVALCHGVDVTTGTNLLRNAAIFAYSVNEMGSILENLTRLGFEKHIPGFLQRGLKLLKNKEDKLFSEAVDKKKAS